MPFGDYTLRVDPIDGFILKCTLEGVLSMEDALSVALQVGTNYQRFDYRVWDLQSCTFEDPMTPLAVAGLEAPEGAKRTVAFVGSSAEAFDIVQIQAKQRPNWKHELFYELNEACAWLHAQREANERAS